MKPLILLLAIAMLGASTPTPQPSPKITWDATGEIPSCPSGYYDPGNSLYCSKGKDPRCFVAQKGSLVMCEAAPITLMDGDRDKDSYTFEMSVEVLYIHGRKVYRVGRGDAMCCWSGPKDWYTGSTLQEALDNFARHEHE